VTKWKSIIPSCDRPNAVSLVSFRRALNQDPSMIFDRLRYSTLGRDDCFTPWELSAGLRVVLRPFRTIAQRIEVRLPEQQ
jgi:hypothetical protein